MIQVSIDNRSVTVPEGTTILEAARLAGIYVPALCIHPNLPPFGTVELSETVFQGDSQFVCDPGKEMDSIKGCGICLVQEENSDRPIPSCKTAVTSEMRIITDSTMLRDNRRNNLKKILVTHPHACLTCAQREGCIPLTDVCPGNVPANERCCTLLNNCELQRIVDYVGIAPETPKYVNANKPVVNVDPLFNRDYNLCIGCGRCVRVCQSVKGTYAMGAVICNDKLTVGTVDGPLMNDAECRFCGSCIEVCPTGALQDKAKARLKGEEELVPCKEGCPGHVDIPLYVRLINEGKFAEAGEVISSKLPLPAVLGKVCFHPCEMVCRRGELSKEFVNNHEPVGIRMLKDFAMSRYDPPLNKSANPTGKQVAVIGGGPAGLTAAYFLALKGHNVTVYERESEVGGMLRYGIPEYRLPAETLNRDLKRILNCGISFKTGVEYGKNVTLQTLKEEGIDSVFIAVGLSKSKSLPVPGTATDSVMDGLDFLKDISYKKFPEDSFKSREIVIIGGGNVAFDAARSAVRLNAEKVTVVCLEKRTEMPAYPQEILEAAEEGVIILNEWGVSSIVKNDKEHRIDLRKCISAFNEKSEFAPEYDETNTDCITADTVIICIGQDPDSSFINGATDLKLNTGDTIQANRETLKTKIPGVFAGGDIVTGPASVIDAVAAGRTAARSIDLYLGGDGIINPEGYSFQSDTILHSGREVGFSYIQSAPVQLIDIERRLSGFSPVEKTWEEDTALSEAGRCLQCDMRLSLQCNPLPPENFLTFDAATIETLEDAEGVVQLLDENREAIQIKGCSSVKSQLLEMLENGKEASYFVYELDPMFTKRESELIQQHLQKYGKMPKSDDDLDDLF